MGRGAWGLKSTGLQESDMTKQLHFHFSAFPKKMTDYFKDILGTIILSPIFQNIIYLYLEIDEEKGIYRYQFSSAQSLSCVQLFSTPWTAACQASLSITNSWNLLKLMSVKLVMPSNHLILHRPPLLLSSIFPSIRISSKESVLHIRWPTYWSFSFSVSPSSEYSGLIFFKIDWFALLAVQGTLKSLLQHHISKAQVLQHSAL